MKPIHVRNCKVTDRNGNVLQIKKPSLGSLIFEDVNGRPRIVRKSWFGLKRVLFPAIEDRIELDCDH